MGMPVLKETNEIAQYIPVSINSGESALSLILTLFPSWGDPNSKVEIMRLTEGTTNTVFKVVNKRLGLSEERVDDAVLKVYGKGTDALVDREKELNFHSVLSRHYLAPPVLARFKNGHIYRFIRGQVCAPPDLARKSIWCGIARRLSEWHAVLPVTSMPSSSDLAVQEAIGRVSPSPVVPNIWTVMQKWILILPKTTQEERAKVGGLQSELEYLVKELGQRGSERLVFGHGDLLSGNVIIEPQKEGNPPADGVETVSFIDYEHATFCPVAFDIANHFAEWGGFQCNYNLLPPRSVRRAFLREYVRSSRRHKNAAESSAGEAAEVNQLFTEVDDFRGVPGFYWALCALVQAAMVQDMGFDYAAYAELRMSEYRDWRDEVQSVRAARGVDMPLRERKWAEEG